MADGAARLEAAFRDAGGPIFVPYIMGGYPTLEASAAHAAIVARHGAVIELGVPYSDPLADGPTIQAAGQRALDGGTRPEDVIEIAEGLRGGPPVVLMTYVNTILKPGVERVMRRVAAAGIAGLIIPDLPVDEVDPVRAVAAEHGVAVIALAAPTTTDRRLAEIGERAEGFVYAVSVAGVTGGSVDLGERLSGFVGRLRAAVSTPIAVGFGIRTPADAVAIGRIADGVVVASQLVRVIEEAGDDADAAVEAYSAEIAAALR